MNTQLAKYHSRSPRYCLNADDNTIIRVAGPQQIPWDENTSIQNISLTGLAFTAPADLCPLLGEIIKIQFTPPGSDSMACYAIVIRIENIDKETKKVGIHYHKMNMGHRLALAQVLEIKIKEQIEKIEKARKAQNKFIIPKLFLTSIFFNLWLLALWQLLHYGH